MKLIESLSVGMLFKKSVKGELDLISVMEVASKIKSGEVDNDINDDQPLCKESQKNQKIEESILSLPEKPFKNTDKISTSTSKFCWDYRI